MHKVKPILVSLKAFDGKQPCMGRVWLLMKTLKRHVLSLWNSPFELPSNLVNVIKNQFYVTWEMLTTNLHYVGAILNPYLLGEVRLHDDADVKEALNKVLLENNGYLNYLCFTFKKLCKFCWMSRFFLTPPSDGPRFVPTWMVDLIGIGGCTFAPIVHYILAQMCFASLCEWNWSSYSFVHNNVRNWLTSHWVEDLVYIYINNKSLIL